MTAKEKEMNDLFGQHDAIRAQMRFLASSLIELSGQLDSKKKPVRLKEWLQNYCYALHDLRDGVRDHIELDERIFKALSIDVKNKRLSSEHNTIKQQIDQAVQLTEEAINAVMNVEELHQRASEIKTIVEKVRKLIDTHTAKEDELLKL
jgi:hypothetical protein